MVAFSVIPCQRMMSTCHIFMLTRQIILLYDLYDIIWARTFLRFIFYQMNTTVFTMYIAIKMHQTNLQIKIQES